MYIGQFYKCSSYDSTVQMIDKLTNFIKSVILIMQRKVKKNIVEIINNNVKLYAEGTLHPRANRVQRKKMQKLIP